MSEELACILVGILASPEDLPPIPGKKSLVVFVNGINELQFSLKIISDGPDHTFAEKTITCYANKFIDYGFTDNYYDDLPVRAKSFEDFIRNKIVLFRPVQQYKKGEILYYAEPVMVLPKSPQVNGGTRLIPMLYLNDVEEDWQGAVLDRRPVGPFRHYPGQMPVADPVYVHMGGFLYGGFDAMEERHGKWVLRHQGVLRRVQCDFFEFEEIITFEDAAFVESGLYLQEFSGLLAAKGEEVQAPAVSGAGEGEDAAAGDAAAGGDGAQGRQQGQETATPHRLDDQALSDADTPGAAKYKSGGKHFPAEVSFISRLIKQCRNNGLVYDENDLYNLHIDLKVNNFVIIAGMSGTGKSRLMCMYAQALGLSQNGAPGGFGFIPVVPSWTDESDLIGFLDTSNNIYRPADTGLLNLLLEAEKNPDQLYVVGLDEMNLARLEHYFAQFLSIFELPQEQRVLQLYNPELEKHIYNAHLYPSQVTIGRNVLWLGTINIDESTYSFSDKVLDRFSLLRLKMLPFMKLVELNTDNKAEIKTDTETLVDARQYRQWVNQPQAGIALNTAEIGFLEQLHQQINEADAKKGISYRTLRHIDQYLANIPKDDVGPLLNRARALDYQLVQKVFPLLRGPLEQMQKLIGSYNEMADTVEDSELLKLMDDYSNISDFNQSRAEIKQKAKELRWFGYAS